MKSRNVGIIAMALVAMSVFSTTSFALSLGGIAKDVGKGASKKVVENEINKNLKEKNCAFKPKSTEMTCDFSEIIKTLNTQRQIAEKSGFANDVEFAEAL